MKTISAFWQMIKKVTAASREAFAQLVEQDANRKFHEELRRERGRLELERQEDRHREQLACEHLRMDGTSDCVYNWPRDGFSRGFLICQVCQAIIRPDIPPSNLAEDFKGHIVNLSLFNALLGRQLEYAVDDRTRWVERPPEVQELYKMPLDDLRKLIENPPAPKPRRRRK